jgi:multiple sugar transport system permease protein
LTARLVRGLVTGFVLAVVLLPIYWMAATSLKTNKEITQDATLYPHAPSFNSYVLLFKDKGFSAFLTNSMVVTAASVVIAVAFGSLGAYAIARFRLRFGLERKVGLALLTLRIVPAVVILVPVYLLILQLKLIDTWAGLILVYTAFNITFCVWMMESFFHDIPVDLEEAAMVDGDSRLTAFIRIALPLAAPGLAATAIFAVIATFNEFLFALALTATPRAMTMPRGNGHADWPHRHGLVLDGGRRRSRGSSYRRIRPSCSAAPRARSHDGRGEIGRVPREGASSSYYFLFLLLSNPFHATFVQAGGCDNSAADTVRALG